MRVRHVDVWMNRLLEYNNKNLVRLVPEVYQHVIQCWANSYKEQPMVMRNRSERWLHDLIEKSGDTLLSGVLKQEKYSPPNSNARMKNDLLTKAKIKPTIDCFNAFLDGLTKGRKGKSKSDRKLLVDNALFAENIMRRLIAYCRQLRKIQLEGNVNNISNDDGTVIIRPNTETFNFVIRGWTRAKHEHDIHKRVLSILRLMESYQRQNITDDDLPRPNTKSYSMAMDALISVAKLKARRYQNNQKMKRHNSNHRVRTYYSDYNNRRDESIQDTSLNGMDEITEATAILKYMNDLYDAGVAGVVPNRVPYNILITGYSALASYQQFDHDDMYYTSSENSGAVVFKAEEILRTMMSHRDNGFLEASPDVISYEKVMLAWANSRLPQSGKRCTWLLKQLWKDYELHPESISATSYKSSLLPTVNTYNIVMMALASTDGALAAENLLLDMGEVYKDERRTDHSSLCPNSESFSIVIRAWLESANHTRNVDERIASIRRAYEWLSSLRAIENENNLSTAPQLFTGMLSLLKTCSKQRPQVLNLAESIFEDFRQSRHRLDYISYANLLQVGLRCGKFDVDERERFVEKLFAECCEDGLLSNVFIRALVDDSSKECKNLTDRVLLRKWPLPPSWIRNLKNKNNLPVPNDIRSSTERYSIRQSNRR